MYQEVAVTPVALAIPTYRKGCASYWATGWEDLRHGYPRPLSMEQQEFHWVIVVVHAWALEVQAAEDPMRKLHSDNRQWVMAVVVFG